MVGELPGAIAGLDVRAVASGPETVDIVVVAGLAVAVALNDDTVDTCVVDGSGGNT